MKIQFTKMSGAGNDFVVIDNRARKIKNGVKAARILCDRRWGVGADGLLLLEASRRADYRMMYYNADGSFGGMCGNGGRCIAKFADMNRIAPRRHKFEALDYIYSAFVNGSAVTLEMKDPRNLRLYRRIQLDGIQVEVNQVDTGAPHVVVSAGSLAGRKPLKDLNMLELGEKIRNHKAFKPEGTNANVIERRRGNSIYIRTYERGVEAETLACGTGAIASAIVASRTWKLKSPVTVVPASGKALRVEFSTDGNMFADVKLTGPATVSFSGTFELPDKS